MENSWTLKDVNGKITNLRVKECLALHVVRKASDSEQCDGMCEYKAEWKRERQTLKVSLARPDNFLTLTLTYTVCPNHSCPFLHTSLLSPSWDTPANQTNPEGPDKVMRMNQSERLATQWTMSYTCERNSFQLFLCCGLQETGEKSGNWQWMVCMRVCAYMFNLWPSWQIHYLC